MRISGARSPLACLKRSANEKREALAPEIASIPHAFSIGLEVGGQLEKNRAGVVTKQR
jgi:hypothetical protein